MVPVATGASKPGFSASIIEIELLRPERKPAWLSIRGCQTPMLADLAYSHSIVPGGFDVTSYTTLFTPFTSLMMRVAVSPRNFMSNW